MQVDVTQTKLSLLLPDSLYSEEILYKCFYWYAKEYAIAITKEDAVFTITVESKDGLLSEERVKYLVGKIKQDLIDFKLRAIVTHETKTVRELIVAKAFAYYGAEASPTTQVSDPVGFDPNTINLYE